VFVKPASGPEGWLTQAAELTSSDVSNGDEFGGALAISGEVIVAGAPGHPTGKNTEQGAAYTFVEPATGWRTTTETGELLATGGAAGDKLGLSVAISAGTILLGAPNRAVGGNLAQGVVYALPGPLN
jgi:hypothetical protein